MGLDQYLTAKKYMSGYRHNTNDELAAYKRVLASVGLTEEDSAKGAPGVYVEVNVAYWRKANQIHKWFVDNAQSGEDDCKAYYVERAQLDELASQCELALMQRSAKLLPPQAGCFFGDTSIDEYYFEELKATATTLRGILSNPKFQDCEFEYRASW